MEYIDNYALRSHRKRSGLTQEDVAVLIGAQSPSQVSRQENGEREPDLRAALAYRIIFDAPIRHVVPKLYREIAQQVHTQAEALATRLKESGEGLHATHRVEHLRQMAGRISLFELDV
jgi:transcriptional regulator with XRE-family HTH domain